MERLSVNVSKIIPSFYKRLIDDGFDIWKITLDELYDFMEHASSQQENIKVDLQRIYVLDTYW